MGNAQLVLCETDVSGVMVRTVPYLDIRGGRLSYLRNDLMYFGHSLPWQRLAADEQARTAPELAMRIGVLDARLHAPADRHYLALYFTQSRVAFRRYQRWTEPELRGGFRFDVPSSVRAQFDAILPYPSYDLPPGHFGQARRLVETTEALRDLQAQGAFDGLEKLAAWSPLGPAPTTR